jgi:hypothetical protein
LEKARTTFELVVTELVPVSRLIEPDVIDPLGSW